MVIFTSHITSNPLHLPLSSIPHTNSQRPANVGRLPAVSTKAKQPGNHFVGNFSAAPFVLQGKLWQLHPPKADWLA